MQRDSATTHAAQQCHRWCSTLKPLMQHNNATTYAAQHYHHSCTATLPRLTQRSTATTHAAQHCPDSHCHYTHEAQHCHYTLLRCSTVLCRQHNRHIQLQTRRRTGETESFQRVEVHRARHSIPNGPMGPGKHALWTPQPHL